MLGVAFLLLGIGMVAVFQPALAEPIFSALQLYNYQIEIGSAFVVVAMCLFVKRLFG
jgi:hypothetical protein